MFLFVAAALAFGACQSDGDFAAPSSAAFQANNQQVVSFNDDPQGLVACMDVLTLHDVAGHGKLSGSYYSSFSGPVGTYVITGNGTVLSDPLKDGVTSVKFTYQTWDQAVDGSLYTELKNGAVLEQQFSGVAQRTVQGKEMTLTLTLSGGLLNTDNELMELSEGLIVLTLPSEPIGTIDIDIETKGVYCTTD